MRREVRWSAQQAELTHTLSFPSLVPPTSSSLWSTMAQASCVRMRQSGEGRERGGRYGGGLVLAVCAKIQTHTHTHTHTHETHTHSFRFPFSRRPLDPELQRRQAGKRERERWRPALAFLPSLLRGRPVAQPRSSPFSSPRFDAFPIRRAPCRVRHRVCDRGTGSEAIERHAGEKDTGGWTTAREHARAAGVALWR